MTDEIINQGIKLRDSIKEINDVLYSITPYLHNDIEITVQKKILNCNKGEKLYYRLKYDSPLWIAIESSLKDMRSDFQKQFDELNSNSENKNETPIKKSWWKLWKKIVMISKKTREIVYNKYNGHCAYCGCEIEMKDMQVDHIVPKYRNNEMWHKGKIGTDEISNLNPSCRMCNFYKGMSSIEKFREKLKDSLMRNLKVPFDFRLAGRYGMVKIEEWDGKFYFEKMEE